MVVPTDDSPTQPPTEQRTKVSGTFVRDVMDRQERAAQRDAERDKEVIAALREESAKKDKIIYALLVSLVILVGGGLLGLGLTGKLPGGGGEITVTPSE